MVPVLSVRRTVYWPMSFSRTVPIVSLCSRADELLSWWSALSALIVCDSCVHSTVDKNKVLECFHLIKYHYSFALPLSTSPSVSTLKATLLPAAVVVDRGKVTTAGPFASAVGRRTRMVQLLKPSPASLKASQV